MLPKSSKLDDPGISAARPYQPQQYSDQCQGQSFPYDATNAMLGQSWYSCSFLELVDRSEHQVEPDYTRTAEQIYCAVASAGATDR